MRNYQQANCLLVTSSLLFSVFFHDICFKYVAFFDVVEFLQAHTALVAGSNLFDVVFKPLEAVELVVGDDDAIPDDTDVGAAGNLALQHITSGHGANIGDRSMR